MTAQAQTETLHTQLTDIIAQHDNRQLLGIPPTEVATRIIAKLQELNPNESHVYETKMTETQQTKMLNVLIFERYSYDDDVEKLIPYARKTFLGVRTTINLISAAMLGGSGYGLANLYPTVNPNSDLNQTEAIILTCALALLALAFVELFKRCAEEYLNTHIEKSGAVLEHYVESMANQITYAKANGATTDSMNMRNETSYVY